ncbi:hypothetical protein KIW84_043500 [Lathyrus oleraceus]|uniref:Uncharacterized protein n=1 Tax=Pisum sativum TaxID=3888 RepID=A0A9D4XFX4_PEA|nr:hypothetical protein KIW84_043500 [Pisum sativum]
MSKKRNFDQPSKRGCALVFVETEEDEAQENTRERRLSRYCDPSSCSAYNFPSSTYSPTQLFFFPNFVMLVELMSDTNVRPRKCLKNIRLAEHIQKFLKRLVDDHGSIDLEWLRDVPQRVFAERKRTGIEKCGVCAPVNTAPSCLPGRLKTKVDTNVGRIAVHLGWVPLQPLPESLQLHLRWLIPNSMCSPCTRKIQVNAAFKKFRTPTNSSTKGHILAGSTVNCRTEVAAAGADASPSIRRAA